MELENGFTVTHRTMELLEAIEQVGSLNAAAKQLGVSYSHSWNELNRLNCQLDMPVMITQRGGKGGGVAKLTAEGKFLLRRYRAARDTFAAAIEQHNDVSDETVKTKDSQMGA